MEQPEYDLTICICAYNAEKYIAETLESLLAQSCTNFKLLVVDDCSTDRTLSIIQSFKNKGWRDFEIISLSRNGGLAHARKIAEQVVKTEFMQFVDADDLVLPHSAERLRNYLLANQQCMAVGCWAEYINENSEKIGGGIFLGPQSREEFFSLVKNNKLIFISASAMFRTEIAKRVGGRALAGFPNDGIRYQDMCEDLDLWMRMSDLYIEGKYIVVLPEVLLLYRKIPKSVSTNSYAMLLRIKHIKYNLLRRRSGNSELSFSDYMKQLSRWQRTCYAYVDWTLGLYKQAGFFYMKKNFLLFILYMGCATLFNPMYVWDKIRKNILPSLKQKKVS
ncbi:MAG: glycosyltransferase family 2 protein [Lentisphaeria bacterium]|nr:glycosyltransferase family 2 protein [Lentisphaeria bacterium]